MTAPDRAATEREIERLRQKSERAFREAVRQRERGNQIGSRWYCDDGDFFASQANELEATLTERDGEKT